MQSFVEMTDVRCYLLNMSHRSKCLIGIHFKAKQGSHLLQSIIIKCQKNTRIETKQALWHCCNTIRRQAAYCCFGHTKLSSRFMCNQ